MENNASDYGTLTRRECLKYGGAVVGGGVLVGCLGLPDDTVSNGEKESGLNGTSNDSGGDGNYTVSMEPMGSLTFDEPPEQWVALLPSYADMGVALDVGQSLGIQLPERYASHFYAEIPGLEYDDDAVTTLNQNGVDREVFYELDADIHFMEPNQLIHWYDWEQRDIEDITANIGPFFGNFIRRRSDDWHDYSYYSLYEAFEKISQVFQRTDRFERFAAFHDEFLASLQSRIPDDPPQALLLYPADTPPTEFYPYPLIEGGVGKKQWRDLQLRDALSGTDIDSYSGGGGSGVVDLEMLLEIDPDIILIRGQEGKSRAEFEETVVSYLEDHNVAREVAAVTNGEVYRGGYLDQGPIINLFQTELAAQRIYSEEFTEEDLFDRQRVADIINGDV